MKWLNLRLNKHTPVWRLTLNTSAFKVSLQTQVYNIVYYIIKWCSKLASFAYKLEGNIEQAINKFWVLFLTE